jgi:hypothetical protein
LPVGLKPFSPGANREEILGSFQGIPFKEDGVVSDDGRWATWRDPGRTSPKPGLNCSGYLLEAVRLLTGSNVAILDAIKDRDNDSGPDSEMGLDWDYGLDIVMNLSGASLVDLIPAPTEGKLPLGQKGRPEGLGLDINGPGFPELLRSLDPNSVYLFAISKPDRRFKGGLSYYHVGLIDADRAGNLWIYQSTARAGAHRRNLNSPEGIAAIRRYFPPIRSGQRRMVLARLDTSPLSRPLRPSTGPGAAEASDRFPGPPPVAKTSAPKPSPQSTTVTAAPGGSPPKPAPEAQKATVAKAQPLATPKGPKDAVAKATPPEPKLAKAGAGEASLPRPKLPKSLALSLERNAEGWPPEGDPLGAFDSSLDPWSAAASLVNGAKHIEGIGDGLGGEVEVVIDFGPSDSPEGAIAQDGGSVKGVSQASGSNDGVSMAGDALEARGAATLAKAAGAQGEPDGRFLFRGDSTPIVGSNGPGPVVVNLGGPNSSQPSQGLGLTSLGTSQAIIETGPNPSPPKNPSLEIAPNPGQPKTASPTAPKILSPSVDHASLPPGEEQANGIKIFNLIN